MMALSRIFTSAASFEAKKRRNALRFSALRACSKPREFDVLGAAPEDQLAERAQLVESVDNRQEMVAGELADLAGEADRAIGKEDLGLADPAGVDRIWPGAGKLVAFS